MSELHRKPAQEIEIDRLLAEEFACDPGFADRFAAACDLPFRELDVTAVVAEPSLGGAGFGDLLVRAQGDAGPVTLLIEDKITAGPATRQAERYAAYAQRLREAGAGEVATVLVAPAAYRGERARYDADVDLETVATLLRAADDRRLAYRRGIIGRALSKKAASGVQVRDPLMHALHSAHLAFASYWATARGLAWTFPVLRDAYYDGSSWIDPIRVAGFPAGVWLRHRLWTTAKAALGAVDLIVSPVASGQRGLLEALAPEGATVADYSAGKGMAVSLAVPEMRQASGFDHAVAEQALAAMARLVDWYGSLLEVIG